MTKYELNTKNVDKNTKKPKKEHQKTVQEIRFDNFNRTGFIEFVVKMELLDARGDFKLADYSHESNDFHCRINSMPSQLKKW